jgi:hypothetical protein
VISKGDLVKMRLTVGKDQEGKPLIELSIFGKVKNYSEDEDTFIVEPRVISVPKQHVAEITTLPKDFDFEDVSMELSYGEGEKERERAKPADVADIRFSKPSS